MDKRVCIDAGHGGKDPGACSNGVLEKDINLDVARQIAMFLPDVTTMQTRGNDTFVELGDRARAANGFGADFFVSIHCNSAASSEANGFEVYTYTDCSESSKRWANVIYESLLPVSGLRGRGVKQKNLAVLRETDMPAVLIELGFISNAGDRAKLTDRSWQERMSRALAFAVKECLA